MELRQNFEKSKEKRNNEKLEPFEKFEKLSLNDLNKILFSLESEERLEINWGIFNIEGLSGDKQFKFCGLESQYVI